MSRRSALVTAAATVVSLPWLFVAAGDGRTSATTRAAPRRVALSARKFAFSLDVITARAGETIVLELGSLDFVHGFALPQLGQRIDLVPGKTVMLSLTDLRAGHYTYLCDNFCGEAHDKMTGTLVVS